MRQLTSGQWLDIFRQADELGVSFILLAGGEPMLRRDILEAAGKMQSILFPIFTNGTFIDERYFELFDKCRNLVPVMSIEGDQETTDARRGEGIYDKLIANMDEFHRLGLLFGASATVTTENLDEVLSDEFVTSLTDRGCKAVFYIEFVPVTDEAQHLAPGDGEWERIRAGIDRLRETHPEAVFVSFPAVSHHLQDRESNRLLCRDPAGVYRPASGYSRALRPELIPHLPSGPSLLLKPVSACVIMQIMKQYSGVHLTWQGLNWVNEMLDLNHPEPYRRPQI